MTPEEFRAAYPKLRAWIQKTLASYEKAAQPIASMHFVRLPLYFDHSLLETAKFIAVDRMGLAGLQPSNKVISMVLPISTDIS